MQRKQRAQPATITLSQLDLHAQQSLTVRRPGTESIVNGTALATIFDYTSRKTPVIVRLKDSEIAELSLKAGAKKEEIEAAFKSWIPKAPAPSKASSESIKSITIELSNRNLNASQKLTITKNRKNVDKNKEPLSFIEKQTRDKNRAVTIYFHDQVKVCTIPAGATQDRFKRPLERWISSLPEKGGGHDLTTIEYWRTFPEAAKPLELDRPIPFKTLSLLLLPAVIALLYWQRDKIQAWLPEQ